MPLIIDATSGTVLDMSNCYIVFDETFTPEEEAMLASGSDSQISALAEHEGIPLDNNALEWIRYGRLTSVSYGPSALRDEASEMLASEADPDEEVRGWLEWVINEASDAELVWLGECILNDDAVWDGFRTNFVEGLRWRASNPEPF